LLDASIRPDNIVVAVAVSDAFQHGVLSSHIHGTWAFRSESTLEDKPRCNKSACFDHSPFPDPPERLKARSELRSLLEKLETARRVTPSASPGIATTPSALSADEERIRDQGLILIL